MIVQIGHKGRYVGVVGAFRTGQPQLPFELRYQLVPMGEEYLTPEGKDKDNPLIALMESYAQEVKRGNFLARYPRSLHPVQLSYPNAKYVGSEACSGCHPDAYAIWAKSPHPKAYVDLVQMAKRPSLRQYDGECIVCHTVGFAYRTGFADENSPAFLRGVGCESCHGPASEHVAKPHNQKARAALNPFKIDPAQLAQAKAPAARGLLRHQHELLVDKFCQSCHDIDNDVHWNFDKNWPMIVHMTPRPGKAGGAGQPQAAPQATAEPVLQAVPEPRPRGLPRERP
jgi:hypothetical protein